MALYLTEADIGGLLTMSDVVDALEEMCLARAKGEVVNRPRVRVPIVDGTYNLMAAGWVSRGVVGHKTYTASPGGASCHIALYAADGSGLIAWMAGGTISGLRTGAMTALAARQFATRRDGPIAVIGTGSQATAQVIGLRTTMPEAEIRVFSRSAERRVAFAARVAGLTAGTCRAVDSIEAALDGASVAVTITNSADPVLFLEHLSDGLTVVAAGNNTLAKAEIDPAAIGRADLVVVDDLDNAKLECGELTRAADAGVFDWDSAVELHDVVGGTVAGRTSADQIVLVELQGIAAADVAVADLVIRRAREKGVGLGATHHLKLEHRIVQPLIDLDGKRVVVTGGATGIGRATCLYLAALGARVAVLDRDVASGTQTTAEITDAGGAATFFEVDVADEASVARALDEAAVWLGGLDGVINSAGILKGSYLAIDRVTPEIWSQVLAVNLTGSLLVAKHASSHMIPNHAGVIILIGSKAGVAGGSGSLAYGASKGGVHGLAMSLDRILAADGIRVYEVCPGSMETPLRRGSVEEGVANGADEGWFGRPVGAPEGVAAVLAFLLTDGAEYLPMTIVVEKRRDT